MEPTLHVGDRLLVNRFSHRVLGRDPKVGDILVFKPAARRGCPATGTVATSAVGGGTQTPCGQPTSREVLGDVTVRTA